MKTRFLYAEAQRWGRYVIEVYRASFSPKTGTFTQYIGYFYKENLRVKYYQGSGQSVCSCHGENLNLLHSTMWWEVGNKIPNKYQIIPLLNKNR